MTLQKTLITLCACITMFAQSAAKEPGSALIPIPEHASHHPIHDVIGCLSNGRGRWAIKITCINPATYSFLFMYADHPKLTKGYTLENILMDIAISKTADLPTTEDDLRRGRAEFEERIRKAFLNANISKQPADSELHATATSAALIYDILLTKRWLHVKSSSPDHSSNGLWLLKSKRYSPDHLFATGDGRFHIWPEQIGGTDATMKARMHRERNPEKPFHLVIDNYAWQKLCASCTEPLSPDEKRAESALKKFVLGLAQGE